VIVFAVGNQREQLLARLPLVLLIEPPPWKTILRGFDIIGSLHPIAKAQSFDVAPRKLFVDETSSTSQSTSR
jgi:hypothetical protein